jgi:hypothetical protein
MSQPSYTCAGCEQVRLNPFGAAYCHTTDLIIPHDNFSTPEHITFFRVPDFCPRPEGDVVMSAKPQAKKRQQSIPIKNIPMGS